MTLADLLAPVGVEAFLADHWERAPLLVQPGAPCRFASLLTLGHVEMLLGSQTFRRSETRLVDADTPIHRSDYVVGDIVDAARVFAMFQQGATVVFERLDHRWPALRRLCRALEQALGHAAQTNVYLTGGRRHGRAGESAQGLRRHYDTHDVFVLQVAGSKRWRLFGETAELPVKAMPSRPADLAVLPVVREFDLGGGDLLYLPRGWVHEAEATNESSLHVTLGLLATSWGGPAGRGGPDRGAEGAGASGGPLAGAAPAGRGRPPATFRRGARCPRAQRCTARGLAQTRCGLRQRPGAAARRPVRPARRPRRPDDRDPRVTPVDGDRPVPGARPRDRGAAPAGRDRLPAVRRRSRALRTDLDRLLWVADMSGGLDEAGRLVLVRRLIREGLVVIEP